MDREGILNDLEQEAEAGPDPTNSDMVFASNGSFRRYSSSLLMIIGLSLIGFFLASWVANVLIEQRMGSWIIGTGQAERLLWRILASAINMEYLYAIVGIILCLLAIHTRGRENWRKASPAFILFAALNAVALTVGFFALVFVLDWGGYWSEFHVSTAFSVILFLVEVSAFIAIIVIEIPYLQEWFGRLFRTRASEPERLDEPEETGNNATGEPD